MKKINGLSLFILLMSLPMGNLKIESCDCDCDCAGNYRLKEGECCGKGGKGLKPTPRTCTVCPNGYLAIEPYGCYFAQVAKAKEGWSHDDADRACKSLSNGRLASMDNSTMYDDIHSKIVAALSGIFELFWLSAEYHSIDFFWANGKRLRHRDYMWWDGNDPTKAEDGFCVYAFGNMSHMNCLSYTYCTVGLGFLCEKQFMCSD